MEKVIIKSNNSRVMDSIENASISITSPTGRTIYLRKLNLSNKNCTEEMREVFWKCANDPMIRFIGNIELTRKEMELALQFSKI